MLLLILYNDFVDKKNMIQLQNIKQELNKSVLPVKNIEHHRTLVPLRWNWPGGGNTYENFEKGSNEVLANFL